MKLCSLGLRRRMMWIRKTDSQQTYLGSKYLTSLNLNLLAQEVCGLLLSVILFHIEIRLRKINIAVTVFQRIIIILRTLNTITMNWKFS